MTKKQHEATARRAAASGATYDVQRLIDAGEAGPRPAGSPRHDVDAYARRQCVARKTFGLTTGWACGQSWPETAKLRWWQRIV